MPPRQDRFTASLAYEMKLNENYDTNNAKKNGHVVLLSEGACRFHEHYASCGRCRYYACF